MCGIAAYYNPTSQGVTKNDMKNFNQTLYRRGPDSDGYWINTNNTLGLSMQRLSILDLNNGYQPMFDTTENYAIVFNGEIFNCNKLRIDLEKLGCEFKTKNSDTEVILNGYKYYGNKISSLLNGMFAFVIYDKIKPIIDENNWIPVQRKDIEIPHGQTNKTNEIVNLARKPIPDSKLSLTLFWVRNIIIV